MIRYLTVLLALCLLPAIEALAANDFSGDPNCVIVWNLEDAALIDDTGPVGTNDLTTNSTVTSDGTYYRQGTYSGRWNKAETDYMRILDSELSSGVSIKSDYAGDIDLSLCLWFRADTSTVDACVFNKYNATGSKRQIRVQYMATNYIHVTVGGSDGSNTAYNVNHASTLSDDTWYHLTVTWADATRTCCVRVRDTAGSAVGSDVEDSGASYTMKKADSPIHLGDYVTGSDYFDGYLDEVVVWNDVLGEAESTQVSTGAYGGGAAAPIVAISHRRHSQ
jgi:hypothetical protein